MSKLEEKPRKPVPPLLGLLEWQPKILSNTLDIEAKSILIRDQIQRHKKFSPISIIEALNQFKMDVEMIQY